jgi:ribose transport system substrate-binding protein
MKQLRLLLSLPGRNNYQQEQAAAAVETASQIGATVEVIYADNDAVNQSQQILQVIQSKSNALPDAILFEPLTSTGLVRVGEAAVAAGIGWVVLNSDVDYVDRLRKSSTAPVSVVTRDHVEIGRIQARQFAALLPDGGSVLYIQGPVTSSAATQRTEGLESAKPANLRIKMLRSQWSEEDAYKTVSAWLRLSTNRAETVDLVGCQYDGIAMGARKAFQDHGNVSERDQWLKRPIAGVDGLLKEGQAWVREGILTATVVGLTTTRVAIQMLQRAISSGVQPQPRSLIELSSYPPLEAIAAIGNRLHAKKSL